MTGKKILVYSLIAGAAWYIYQSYAKQPVSSVVNAEPSETPMDNSGTQNPFVMFASQVRSYFAL